MAPVSWEGHVVAVTGAASGIGRATATAFAAAGAEVAAIDADGAALAGVVDEQVTAGRAASAWTVDVGDAEAVDRVAGELVDRFGQVDSLVHCAAVNHGCPVLDLSVDAWRSILSVNLDGAFFVGRAFGRAMSAQGRGAMVFLTSDLATLGSPDFAAYSASKGGVIGLVKSLALALGPRGVTVNALNPGTTDTPMARGGLGEAGLRGRREADPLGKISDPSEIAATVMFLCGPARSFMTGQVVGTRML